MRTANGQGAGVDGFFDDNYFDMLPGEVTTVSFRPNGPANIEALRSALGAISINDSY
jgi:hypothetical protein